MTAVISFLMDANYFSGLATILTGVVVIWIYFKQKDDKKSQIARLILLEVRTAEEKIMQTKNQIENGSTVDLPSVLPLNSWEKYAYLFVSDFDNDEIKLISSFYEFCGTIEDFAKRDNNFFWVTTEERARVVQAMLGKVIDEGYSKAESDRDLYISEKKAFISAAFDKHGLVYSPQKPVNEIKSYLNKIQTITTSTCGAKLKKLARLR